jgi:hypothetical protein
MKEVKEVKLDEKDIEEIMNGWDFSCSYDIDRRKRDSVVVGLQRIINGDVSNHRFIPILKYIIHENYEDISARQISNFIMIYDKKMGSRRKLKMTTREISIVLKRLCSYGYLLKIGNQSHGNVYALNTDGYIVQEDSDGKDNSN